MTKRLLAMALCAILMLALLAGCGSSAPKAEEPSNAPAAAPAEDPAPAPEAPAEEPESPAEEPVAEPETPSTGSGSGSGQRPSGGGNRTTALGDPLAPLTGPVYVPSAFTDGTYRIVAGEAQLTREGSVVYSDGTIMVWAVGDAAATTTTISTAGPDEPLHYVLQSIGANSSFTVSGGEITAITLRPPTFGTTERNAKYLTADFMEGVRVTVACNPKQSPEGGAVTPTDTSIVLSDTLTVNVDLRDGSDAQTVELSSADGTVISGSDENGERSFTFTNNGDGTVTVSYTVK